MIGDTFFVVEQRPKKTRIHLPHQLAYRVSETELPQPFYNLSRWDKKNGNGWQDRNHSQTFGIDPRSR
jgi:hypothetical protein